MSEQPENEAQQGEDNTTASPLGSPTQEVTEAINEHGDNQQAGGDESDPQEAPSDPAADTEANSEA